MSENIKIKIIQKHDEKNIFQNNSKMLLKKNEVHVWLISWSKLLIDEKKICEFLNSLEIYKMKQFHFYSDQMRYAAGRAVLNELLPRYIDSSNKKLNIKRNKYGKPYLFVDGKQSDIKFNISHSGEKIGLIFSWNREVGIDIEEQKEIPDYYEIISQSFHSKEEELFLKSEKKQEYEKFFNYWTLKEAYVKGLGYGLSKDLNSFYIKKKNDVNYCVYDLTEESEQWSLNLLKFSENYSGAIAISVENNNK